MAEIIDLKERSRIPPDNLISTRPWEFRRADWGTARFIQMPRSQSDRLEAHRLEGVCQLPSHFTLRGGMDQTVRAVFASRNDPEKMRRIYYLAGLMDCMMNQVSPILRTDLLRAMYKKVFEMKRDLGIHWYGPIDHVLLPLDAQFFDEAEYRISLARARSMKALYQVVREGAQEMFDILSLEYVFYCPGRG
jgi:hypothetical protein